MLLLSCWCKHHDACCENVVLFIVLHTLTFSGYLFHVFLQLPVSLEEVDSLQVTNTPTLTVRKVPKLPKSAPVLNVTALTVSAGHNISINLSLTLPAGTKLTEEAPSCWSLSAEGMDCLLIFACTAFRIS